MAVLINFKICDNSEACDGVLSCPTGAFHWDKKKKTIAVDPKKCVNCGKCDGACPIGVIKFCRTDEEYKKAKEELDKDPRRISDLFIDRYGAQPVSNSFQIDQKSLNRRLNSKKPVAIEFYNDESIRCLLGCIPAKEILIGFHGGYEKCRIKDKSILSEYKIKILPSLLFFETGKLVGKIEGHYDVKDKDKLIKKVKTIIKRVKTNKNYASKR